MIGISEVGSGVRLRLEVRTAARQLPWREVLRPGRGIAYDLLARANPELAARLHNEGWGVHRMSVFGHGAPAFPSALHRTGVYAIGGRGYVELGSPLLAVVEAWAAALAGQRVVDWGGVAFQIDNVHVVEPPVFASGYARLRTATPVVMKGSGRGVDGLRVRRQAWLLPADAEFPVYFVGNGWGLWLTWVHSCLGQVVGSRPRCWCHWHHPGPRSLRVSAPAIRFVTCRDHSVTGSSPL